MVALAVMVLAMQLVSTRVPIEDVSAKVRQHGWGLMGSWAMVGLTQRQLGVNKSLNLPLADVELYAEVRCNAVSPAVCLHEHRMFNCAQSGAVQGLHGMPAAWSGTVVRHSQRQCFVFMAESEIALPSNSSHGHGAQHAYALHAVPRRAAKCALRNNCLLCLCSAWTCCSVWLPSGWPLGG